MSYLGRSMCFCSISVVNVCCHMTLIAYIHMSGRGRCRQFCYVIVRVEVGVAGLVASRNAALPSPFRSGRVLAGPRTAKALR